MFFAGGVSAAVSALLALAAVTTAALVWTVLAAASGVPPAAALGGLFAGALGSLFALEQTLRAAAPLLLTGLCVALPARAGLVVIGGEGALVLGGLAAAVAAAAVPAPFALVALLTGGMAAGAVWLGACAWLRTARGVNEAVSSLMLNYVAIALLNHFVEGPLRDPSSLDRPATAQIPEQAVIGAIGGTSLHWGLVAGAALCVVWQFFISRTVPGLVVRYCGGNARAAAVAGLPVAAAAVAMAALGGAMAGLAGAFEVGAAQMRASAGLVLGYGYAGILVAALARGNLLALIPCAVLVGAIEAGGGLLQRRYGAPAASAEMLHGLIFIALVASEALREKFADALADRRDDV